MEPHQSHRWATGVYCEAHYRALSSPRGTMRGLQPEAGPKAAQDRYGDPGELTQACRYQTFILSCQPPFSSASVIRSRTDLKSALFFLFYQDNRIVSKSLVHNDPTAACSDHTRTRTHTPNIFI